MGTPHEEAPRPNGPINETKGRREFVAAFKSTVNRAVKEIDQFILFGAGPIGSLTINGFFLKYLPTSSHSEVERFTISHDKDLEDFHLQGTFTPYENELGVVGIKRDLSLSREEILVADIGSRNLEVEEMKQLVLVMAQTPMHASLIGGLVEPTEEERVKIEIELEHYRRAVDERDKAFGQRTSIVNDDSYWN